MKRKIIIIALPIIAVILAAAIILPGVFTPKIKAVSPEKLKEASESDENWQTVESGEAKISLGSFTASVNAESSHLTVTDSSTGSVFTSVPQIADAEGKNQSELVITYYDSSSTKQTMNTADNSVASGSFAVKTNGEKIRVIYSIQKSKVRNFVPQVISKETFEEKISSKLESGKRRRLKLFYTLYEAGAKDEAAKEKLEEYPALKKQSLYILSDSAISSTYAEITSYMQASDFNEEDYAKELEGLGIEDSSASNMPAAFSVPVEYSLDSRGLKVSILNDRIESESSSYTLTDIELLPYFSCISGAADGFILVPDGSGAVIDLSSKAGVNYVQSVYGSDTAVEQGRQSAVMQNVGMPIFGMSNADKSFFAVIEKGEAVASVLAEVFGNEYTGTRVYSSFNCKSVDTSDAGALQRKGDLNFYSENFAGENPCVYYMLGAGGATYSDMAVLYREYLKATGTLGERLDSFTPLYLDFTGYEVAETSVMGVSVDKKLLLSDLRGIGDTLDFLKEAGISGAKVRLKAYSDGGIYQKIQNGFDIDKAVGSEKELKLLAQRLEAEGGRLFLENSISTAWQSGNGFKKMNHAVRGLKKTVVKGIDYDLVTRLSNEAEFSFLLTSPIYFEDLTERFIDSFGEKLGSASVYGYSRSDFGSKLWSDFRKGNEVDRTLAALIAETAAAKARESFAEVMTDGSNSYALPIADSILNIPLSSSDFSCESYSVPFYQIAVHGYKSFAGAPINISLDSEKSYLNSAEGGAALYFSCYTNASVPLKESAVGTLIYPTAFSRQSEAIIKYCEEYNKVFSKLFDKEIVSHRIESGGVRVTSYENGTEIAVNYSDSEAQIGGITVAPKSFKVIKEGAK